MRRSFQSESFGFRASNKLGDCVSDWWCNFSPWASSAMEAMKETKFGTKVAYRDENEAQTSNTHIAQRNRPIPHSTLKTNCNMTCVVVTALCNQPEAFALDLGDNQSRCLSVVYICVYIYMYAHIFCVDLYHFWGQRSTVVKMLKHTHCWLTAECYLVLG